MSDPKPKQVNVFAPQKSKSKTESTDPTGDNKRTQAPSLAVLNAWYQNCKDQSRKKHWEMFVIDQFLRGNHNVRGNPNDNTIEVTRRTDSISYPINKIYATFRAVRGYVTRHKPYVEVDPVNSSDEAKQYARRANQLLERDNTLNNYRKINKEWAYYGVKYGVGYRQIGYDPKKKCCVRWSVDPFDLLLGSKTGEMEDCPYLIKTVVRTIGYLKQKYPDKDIAPDNLVAADEYKQLSMQITYQDSNNATQNPLSEQTATVMETWYRLFEPNSIGGLINVVTHTQNTILDFQETPYEEYPFIAYKSDIIPNEAWAEGHVKHIISPQRMLNLLNTHELEYNHIVNRGRFLKDKNAGFRVINSREGQIIEHNPGKQVQVLNPPGVNPLLDKQIDRAIEFMEDIGGQHDASMGGQTPGVTAGVALESLQQGDSNNIQDLRDNFEDALALEATWILKMYSLYEHEGIILPDPTAQSQPQMPQMPGQSMPPQAPQQFAARGQIAMQRTGKNHGKMYDEESNSYYDVCAILPDNQVKVSVNSMLGETKQARIDLLLKLVAAGLPLKFLLEFLEFPNADDIFERIASEQVADMQMQQMQQPPAPVGPPPPPEPPQPPDMGPVLQQMKKEIGDMVAKAKLDIQATASKQENQVLKELASLRDRAAKTVANGSKSASR